MIWASYCDRRYCQLSVVSCPRNQPFRTARVPRGSGLFLVRIILVRKANERCEIALELDLKGVFDGMKAYLINEPTNDVRCLGRVASTFCGMRCAGWPVIVHPFSLV